MTQRVLRVRPAIASGDKEEVRQDSFAWRALRQFPPRGVAADTDVYVRKNSTTDLFSDVLYGANTQKPFDFAARLRDGEMLDFIVGVGPSGKHWSDSTGLRATITRIQG